MHSCAKKGLLGGISASLIAMVQLWKPAHADKKMERTVCNEGHEVIYQVMMEPFHLFS